MDYHAVTGVIYAEIEGAVLYQRNNLAKWQVSLSLVP